MAVTTGLSGNEIYCLAEKNFAPGNIVLGNCVYSLGFVKSITSGFKAIVGGEIASVTEIIEQGRNISYQRMVAEAQKSNASGITGVGNQLVFHSNRIEFLSIGSEVSHLKDNPNGFFSSSANGQDLYAQIDAGFQPKCFVFGNVAYSIGLGKGLLGIAKMFRRGEIKEYSHIFNTTRNLALSRIREAAQKENANAVVGIQTTILPFGPLQEMVMIGTASYSEQIQAANIGEVVTSDMTNIEMWNMTKLGYAPIRLLLGTSIYALGLVGNLTALFKTFVKGEINELSRMLYDARENALGIIEDEAKALGADDVIGVRTYVYQIGNGLVEFLAIGTAVKKLDLKTQSKQLPPQAIIVDKDTFYKSDLGTRGVSLNKNNDV